MRWQVCHAAPFSASSLYQTPALSPFGRFPMRPGVPSSSTPGVRGGWFWGWGFSRVNVSLPVVRSGPRPLAFIDRP
jgi:hypothetical protein